MKFYSKIIIAVLFISTLYSFNASIVPDSKVGYMDLSFFEDLPEYKSVNAEIERFGKKETLKLENKMNEYLVFKEKLERTEGEYTATELGVKFAALEAMGNDIMEKETEFQALIIAKEETLLQRILNRVAAEAESIADEKGYTLLLDLEGNVLYGHKDHDLTTALKIKLGM